MKREKDLIKIMTWGEVQRYVSRHPQWRVPTFNESLELATEHREFWVVDIVGDRRGVHKRGKLEPAHVLFMKHVALVEV